jgi:glutamine synthetase adenylyltransferase
MRELLEQERRARQGRSGLKIASGGYHDLEYALGFRAIVSGVETGGRNLLDQIHTLKEAGALDSTSACDLAAAATLFRGVDHALHLVVGHGFDRPLDPLTSARVATLLSDWGIPEADRFQQAVEERRAEVVRLYETLVETVRLLPH